MAHNGGIRTGRALLDAMQVAVCLVDVRTHRVVDVNQHYLDQLGAGRETVVGRPCHEVLRQRGYPCLGPDAPCPLHDPVGDDPVRVEHVERRVDGSDVHYEICVFPVRDDDGQMVQVVHLIHDVTAQRRSEVALRRARECAEADLQTKTIFLANVSHELRTPLNPIVAMSKLLAMTELDEDQRRYLELIGRGADQLLATVNDLLDFSKAEAGHLALERQDFDLTAVLSECVELSRALCRQRGLALRQRTAPDVPIRLRGDPFRLRQVLLNLLSNAVKFTAQGEIRVGVMRVASEADGVTLRFEVCDSGVGISASQQHRLFESFNQADASVSRRFGGTGLGLAISKQLVSLMEGRIGVESEEGRGSTFWFTARFGRQAARESAAGTTAQASPSPKTGPRESRRPTTPRILVVEDNPSSQLVTLQILKQGGYQVEIVGDGHAALERLRRERFDLVLLDVQMPGLDGIEVARRIRDPAREDMPQGVPIVAVTAHAQPQDREQCRQVGMNGFVAKPVDPADLLETVDRELRRGGDPPAVSC